MQSLSFSGRKDEDVTLFLRNVTRIAFREGNGRDNDWHADYVGTCLSGVALDWYVELDEKVQRNWKDLRMALLKQFPTRGPAPDPPAAAAAPPPSHRASRSAAPMSPHSIPVSNTNPIASDTTNPTTNLSTRTSRFKIPGIHLFASKGGKKSTKGPKTTGAAAHIPSPRLSTHNATGRGGDGRSVKNDGRTGGVNQNGTVFVYRREDGKWGIYEPGMGSLEDQELRQDGWKRRRDQ
ncbi:hypothetical protein FRB94_007207 [Tulasnella sp. JGI-2019a]|nr:hypothetical protein FRB94_007207 [Tulasnella sp. JGI-2019a]